MNRAFVDPTRGALTMATTKAKGKKQAPVKEPPKKQAPIREPGRKPPPAKAR
jgi:hypothetical protein